MKLKNKWILVAIISLVLIAPVSIAAADETISDPTYDVSSIDYITGETTVITSSPYVDIANLDIIEATYTKQNTVATLTMQVRGVIENQGQFIDPYSQVDILNYNALEYGFDLSTSGDDYSVAYCNKTGQLVIGGSETINLTSSDFSVSGNTLSIFFSLTSADETFTSLSATTTYIRANLSNVEGGFTYISDVAPNPPLSVIDAFAYDTGLVGETIQFNATIEPLTGQPPYSYLWKFGDQDTSTELNPVHTYAKAGEYTYNFTVTDNSGATASQSGTITITQEGGGGGSGGLSTQMIVFLVILLVIVVVGVVVIVWIIRRR